MIRSNNSKSTAECKSYIWAQYTYLDEADVFRVLPEALTAHVEPVFTDQSVSVRAYPAIRVKRTGTKLFLLHFQKGQSEPPFIQQISPRKFTSAESRHVTRSSATFKDKSSVKNRRGRRQMRIRCELEERNATRITTMWRRKVVKRFFLYRRTLAKEDANAMDGTGYILNRHIGLRAASMRWCTFGDKVFGLGGDKRLKSEPQRRSFS